MQERYREDPNCPSKDRRSCDRAGQVDWAVADCFCGRLRRHDWSGPVPPERVTPVWRGSAMRRFGARVETEVEHRTRGASLALIRGAELVR